MRTMDFKDQGNEAFKRGEFRSAIDLYTEALQLDSHNPVLYSNRAMCHFKLKQWNKVVEDCSKGLQADPSNKTKVKLLYRRGGAHAELGSSSAENDLLEALKFNPGNSSVRELLKSLNGENKLKKQKTGVIPLEILEVEYLPGEEVLKAKNFEKHSEEPVSVSLKDSSSLELGKEGLPEPSIYNLTNMHTCAESERPAAYRYILDIYPSRYSEIFKDGGLEPDFINFFFDAVLYLKEARLGREIFNALSLCDRFELTLLLCDSVKLNRVNDFMQVDA